MEWYYFKPSDTLYFKGAEPMAIGVDHEASSVFPPSLQTLTGSLRTAILMQNELSVQDYYNGKIDDKFLAILGPSDGVAGFQVSGPLLNDGKQKYIPAPYNWYYDKDSGDSIIVAENITGTYPFKTSGKNILWAKKGEPLGGKWIPVSVLSSLRVKKEDIKSLDCFFEYESRTGIALDYSKSKRVKNGHIYTADHIRLKTDCQLCWAVDVSLPIDSKGILFLGGEKRLGAYERKNEEALSVSKNHSGLYMTLSPVEGNERINNVVYATGKLQYFGGWDMKKRFHKPMIGYYPAGTVFSEKIDTACVAL